MHRRNLDRKRERGVTLIIVALGMLALIAMAALAIDVATLYVARADAQHAADAAALAGAKMFVSSGFTSGLLGDPTDTTVQSNVCQSGGAGLGAAANKQAEAIVALNQISGLPATVQTISCNFNQPNNPQIAVTIQRTGLPVFFAKIWGTTSATTTATATGEAYNPSGAAGAPPLQLTNVKPWLVANCDASTGPGGGGNPNCAVGGNHYPYFVDPATGAINNNGAFIGRRIYLLRTRHDDPPSPPAPSPPDTPTGFYVMNVPIAPPTAVCPSNGAPSCNNVAGGGGGTAGDYRDNIACSSQAQFFCGQVVGAGQTVGLTSITGAGYGNLTSEGARCLIHASNDGLNRGQDTLTAPNGFGTPPIVVGGGDNNPNASLQNIDNISRSDSIVTVPLFDGGKKCLASGVCNNTATIQGFLQIGIRQTNPPGGSGAQVEGVILNAVGCGGTAGNPVVGGGVATLPVRLIQQ